MRVTKNTRDKGINVQSNQTKGTHSHKEIKQESGRKRETGIRGEGDRWKQMKK